MRLNENIPDKVLDGVPFGAERVRGETNVALLLLPFSGSA